MKPKPDTERCPCGRPLHYSSPEAQRMVESFIDRLGREAVVIVGDRAWAVPRHYIALHGLRARDLPELSKQFGFKEVPQP